MYISGGRFVDISEVLGMSAVIRSHSGHCGSHAMPRLAGGMICKDGKPRAKPVAGLALAMADARNSIRFHRFSILLVRLSNQFKLRFI